MDIAGAVLHQSGLSDLIPADTQSVGEVLFMARKRANLSISDVAAATKIGSDYLEAIEAMDRAALPPRAYALGFVRCYADHLGLDAEEIVSGFRAQFYDGVSPMGDLSPRPAPAWVDFRLPRGTGIVMVITCAMALATWYGLRTPSEASIAVLPVPEALADWVNSEDLLDVPALPSTQASLDGS